MTYYCTLKKLQTPWWSYSTSGGLALPDYLTPFCVTVEEPHSLSSAPGDIKLRPLDLPTFSFCNCLELSFLGFAHLFPPLVLPQKLSVSLLSVFIASPVLMCSLVWYLFPQTFVRLIKILGFGSNLTCCRGSIRSHAYKGMHCATFFPSVISAHHIQSR